jgi:hypothetical protein
MTLPFRSAISLLAVCGLLFVLARPAATAQTLKMTPVNLVETCTPGASVETRLDIENLTGAALTIRIERKACVLPADWIATFCLINCYSPDATDVEETLEPYQKASFKLDWLTSTTPAEGDIEYQFSNKAAPSEQYKYHFRVSTLTSAESSPAARPMALAQNYPNPFSLSGEGGVRISFTNPRYAPVSLRIYNLLGREVRTVLADARPAGSYSLFWDGRDNGGNAVAPGIYIYKFSSGTSSLSRRMVVAR